MESIYKYDPSYGILINYFCPNKFIANMETKHESKSFHLNDFDLTLTLDHSQLSIRAEHCSTLSTYSVSLNNDTAKSLQMALVRM